MISILIPVYNLNVIPLVTALQRQGEDFGIPFEILVADDASYTASVIAGNASLSLMPNVRYHAFTENLGAQRIRHVMAGMALYPTLLLVDSDAMVLDDQFYARYAALADAKTVVFGGIAYEQAEHRDNLRWWYGTNRESYLADKFNRRPGNFLTTFNLLIPREALLGEMAPENMTRYGHEDTFLSMQLEKDGVPIVHINNPLLHTGLSSNEDFLRQTEGAIHNLWALYSSYRPLSLLRKRSRLVRLYEWLRRTGMHRVYGAWFILNENRLRQNLLSAAPSLRKMDQYKLGKFIEYSLA